MASIKTGLIQVALKGDAEDSPDAIRERMIEAPPAVHRGGRRRRG